MIGGGRRKNRGEQSTAGLVLAISCKVLCTLCWPPAC